MVLIDWIWPKINGLDLGVTLVLIGWVRPKEIHIAKHKKSPTIKNQQTNVKLSHELV